MDRWIFNAEARRWRGMVFNRVEHVDHVEDLEMGFHPIPRMRANRGWLAGGCRDGF